MNLYDVIDAPNGTTSSTNMGCMYHHVSPCIIMYHHASSSIIKYHHVSPRITMYHHSLTTRQRGQPNMNLPPFNDFVTAGVFGIGLFHHRHPQFVPVFAFAKKGGSAMGTRDFIVHLWCSSSGSKGHHQETFGSIGIVSIVGI